MLKSTFFLFQVCIQATIEYSKEWLIKAWPENQNFHVIAWSLNAIINPNIVQVKFFFPRAGLQWQAIKWLQYWKDLTDLKSKLSRSEKMEQSKEWNWIG